MKIECVLRRPEGTAVNVGGIDYRFEPDASGRHVADVEDSDHARTFASIQGYRIIPALSPAPAKEETMSSSDDRFVAAVQAHKDAIEKLTAENKSLKTQLAAANSDIAASGAYKDQVSAFLEAATASINAALTPVEAPVEAPASN